MNKSKVVYSDELLEIIERNQKQLLEIKEKYGEDSLINRGLFLMTTTCFEAMIRDLLQKILYCKPEKFKKKEFNINKEELSYCENDSIIKAIIDKELYHLFREIQKNNYFF